MNIILLLQLGNIVTVSVNGKYEFECSLLLILCA